MTKGKRTNNHLQNITQKTQDRATQAPCAPEGYAVPVPHVAPVVLLLNVSMLSLVPEQRHV